jgi:hypothetical protein
MKIDDEWPEFGSPWLGWSHSAIRDQRVNVYGAVQQIETHINMAYYVGENDVSDFAGDCSRYWQRNGHTVAGQVSNFYLDKWMTLGATVAGRFFPNILYVDSRVTVPRPVEDMDVTLVAYMSALFTDEFIYDPVKNVLTQKTRGQPLKDPTFHNSDVSPTMRIFSDRARGTAFGVITHPDDKKDFGPSTVYTMTESDIVHPPNYTFVYRNVASQHYFSGLDGVQKKYADSHTSFAIGSVERLKEIARAYCTEWKLCP